MPGLGLQGPGGLAGGYQALEQILHARQLAEQEAYKRQQEAADNVYKQKQLGQQQSQFTARLGLDQQELGTRQQQFQAEAPIRQANLAHLTADTGRIISAPAEAATQRGFLTTSAATEHGYKMGEIRAAGENRPTPTVTINTVNDQGQGVTRVVPKADAMNKDFVKPPNATTANRLDSAAAVTQTGDDIVRQIADPNLAAKLGPIAGRYTNVQEFIGNPPPEFAQLAGEIESFSIANMGVHGMRSAQGAAMIKALMESKLTPEALSATVTGLMGFTKHFLENSGRSVPGGTTPSGGSVNMRAPNGQTKAVPADQVEHYKSLGATVVP